MDNIDGNKRIYGIDLGMTNSAIAFINDNGKPEIIPNSDNERITPSVVFFDKPSEEGKLGNVVVGKVAQESAKIDPTRVISFVKKEMGTGWTMEIDGITLTPEEVSAYILKRLVRDAKLTAGHDVKDVVITCPAYFGADEHHATVTACKIAGLNVLQLLDEPVAAVLHYGLDKLPNDSTAIVYDLGGGTFDVTVVAIEGGDIRVVCTDGDHRLGGKNWDERIAEYFASKFAEATGIDKDVVMGDADTLYDLQLQAEVVKQMLSRRSSAKVKVSFGGNSERIELTRETFDEITRDLLDQTAYLTQEMFDLATIRGITRIDNFVLAGGATRMPQVMEMVREKFASRITNAPLSFEVDEAVAKGAALFGKKCFPSLGKDLAGESGSNAINEICELPSDGFATPGVITILPKASRSYGVRFATDASSTVENIIVKDEVLPLESKREFPVTLGNSDKIVFQVYANETAGETAPSNTCEEIGEVVIKLPHERSGDMRVRIQMSLSKEEKLSLDVSYLTIRPGTPAHVEFLVKPDIDNHCYEEMRREIADLIIE